ncbi:MAG TPA: septum formation initiator family protein [Terrimesophilobacter sp.]|jgi:cell division protein FtsB|nr:septum formation initiator family protein [Terrimesophilobacter sp.]
MTRRPRTTRVPVRLPQPEGPAARWLRSIRLSGFTIAALCVVVLMVVILAPSLRTLVEQRTQLAQLEAEVAAQKSGVSDLKGEHARWEDPSYIEAQARERLNYVYPGEYSYLVMDDGATPTTKDGLPISSSIQTTRVDWVQALLSSVLTAGLTDATPNEIVAPVLGGSR